MSDLVQIEFLILGLLLIVSFVGIMVRRFRIPYTAALVIVGIILSFQSSQEIELTSELILFLFLPPLLFEAAIHIDLRQLREDFSTISILAIIGVVLSMLVVGGIVAVTTDIPIEIALVFGALIAATDPVSVVAIFRKLGAPKRLEILLESESLFNDGTAVVLYGLALEALVLGKYNIVDGVLEFTIVSGGGLVIGLGLGWVVSRLIAIVDDYLIETTLTTVLAFGAYIIAEQLHVSGVLAVVAAGLITGSIGERAMSPTSKIVVRNFWEYVAFLVNSVVFLLLGLQIEISSLLDSIMLGLIAVFAVLVARAIVIYGLARLGRAMPTNWRHVMFWGGLRGAIALALALSLPAAMGEYRNTLTLMTFSVVLFTLLIQGVSMEPLLRRLGLLYRSDAQIEFEERQARAISARAGYVHVEQMYADGLVSNHTWERLRPIIKQRVEALTTAVQAALQDSPELVADELITARRESLRAQRNSLGDLRSDGVISMETYDNLVAEIDIALDSTPTLLNQQLGGGSIVDNICQFLLVIVQDRDLESVLNALAIRNIMTTKIQSSGGFLRRKNHVLIVGVPDGMLSQAEEAIRTSSSSRVEKVRSPMVEALTKLGEPTSVQVEGATMFVFDIERCEVI